MTLESPRWDVSWGRGVTHGTTSGSEARKPPPPPGPGRLDTRRALPRPGEAPSAVRAEGLGGWAAAATGETRWPGKNTEGSWSRRRGLPGTVRGTDACYRLRGSSHRGWEAAGGWKLGGTGGSPGSCVHLSSASGKATEA